MGWAARCWINHKAVTIWAVIVAIVRWLDQQGQQVWLQLLHDVIEGLSEWATCIDATLTNELRIVASGVDSLFSEHGIVWISLATLLEDLTEDRDSAFVIGLALRGHHWCLVPVDCDRGRPTIVIVVWSCTRTCLCGRSPSDGISGWSSRSLRRWSPTKQTASVATVSTTVIATSSTIVAWWATSIPILSGRTLDQFSNLLLQDLILDRVQRQILVLQEVVVYWAVFNFACEVNLWTGCNKLLRVLKEEVCAHD